jgi:hypothetical protein
MKTKNCGWINGEFHFLVCMIARFNPGNDPDFDKKVSVCTDALATRLRPGKMTSRGRPTANTTFSRYLCDVLNHVYSGRWSDAGVSESHLNIVAKNLGWPEIWKPGGDVNYAVNSRDLWLIDDEIRGTDKHRKGFGRAKT